MPGTERKSLEKAEELNDKLRALRHKRGTTIQDCIDLIAKEIDAAVKEEREECAELAGKEGCTHSGCERTFHTLLCPIGIAQSIRARSGEGAK